MKILILILSPCYLVGALLGLLFIPFRYGFTDGITFLMSIENKRINKILKEESEKRNINYEALRNAMNRAPDSPN